MPVYSALLLAVLRLSAGGRQGETMTESLHQYGNRACALVKEGHADEATLDTSIYVPLSAGLFGQIRSGLGNMAQDDASAQGPLGGKAMSQAIGRMSTDNDRLVTNGAAALASTIRERYQELFAEKNGKTPDAPSFEDHAKGDYDRTAISSDVRLYCGKLEALGAADAFSPKSATP